MPRWAARGGQLSDAGLDRFRQVQHLQLQIYLARFDLVQVQQFIDESQHPLAGGFDFLNIFLLFGGERVGPQQLVKAHDGVHRGP